MDSVQQKLRRGFAEMEEREQIEAHPHLLRFVEARQQLSLARAVLLANRRHELHRALESRGTGAAEDFCPQLDDAPQEQQIPAQLPVVTRKELATMHRQPGSEVLCLAGNVRECDNEQHAIERADLVVEIEGSRSKQAKGAAGTRAQESAPLPQLGWTCDRKWTAEPLELQPLAGRDIEGTREGEQILRRRFRSLARCTAAQRTQHVVRKGNERRPLLRAKRGDSPVLFERDQRVVRRRHECHAGRKRRCCRWQVHFHSTPRTARPRDGTVRESQINPTPHTVRRISHGSVTTPGAMCPIGLQVYGNGI